MDIKKLPFKNLKANRGHTLALTILIAVLAITVFCGSTLISGVEAGLANLGSRLGSDLIVVSDTARSRANLDQVVDDGIPGAFYMDASFGDEIAQVEGVERLSPQYYLATVETGYSESPVTVIGMDPTTDFTVSPWVGEGSVAKLGANQVVVGAGIDADLGSTLELFGVTMTVVARLDATDTVLDQCLFCDFGTADTLRVAAQAEGIDNLPSSAASSAVSLYHVKVSDFFDVQSVVDYINLYVRGATAVAARTMNAGISDSTAGVQKMLTWFAIVVWILVAAILVVVFWIFGKQRHREFAVLRVVGASRSQLMGVVMREALVEGLVGACAGVVVGLVLMLTLKGVLGGLLNLPFLLPGAGTLVLLVLLTLVVTVVVGCGASAFSARSLSRVDPGQFLRGE